MKKFGTKCIALFLVLCLAIPVLPVSALAKDSDDSKIENAELSIWGVKSPYPFSFDFRSLTEGDNQVYSQSLSIFASLMAEDVSIQKGRQIVVDNRDGYFMEQMGFKDVERIVLDSNDYFPYDYNDISVVYIGRRPVKIDNKEYMVYGVGVVDSYGSAEFWKSNVDIGAPGDEYTDVTGEHEDSWNTDHAKGFDVTTNRVYEKVQEYLGKYAEADSQKQKSILFTGHSRGAAIANLLGKIFEDKKETEFKDYKPYTYTYATPYTTTVDEDTAQSYKTIFNVINENDLIANVPPTDVEEWDFRRYGTDKIVDIDDNEDMVDEWNKSIAPMIEAELKTPPTVDAPRENTPVVDAVSHNFTPENGIKLLSILHQMILQNKEELEMKYPTEVGLFINELEMADIDFTKNPDIEYVSACGAEVPEIIGELITSRVAMYTKDVETTLSFDEVTTMQQFEEKLDELGLTSYCTIEGAMDSYYAVPVKICPAILLESAFSIMSDEKINTDYVRVILDSLLYEESGEYLSTIINVLLYAPDLINGIRPCHSAQTYYYLANKIAGQEVDEKQDDKDKKDVVEETAGGTGSAKDSVSQGTKSVDTGDKNNLSLYVVIGCVAMSSCLALLVVQKKKLK